MEWPIKSLSINSILLDTRNIRLPDPDQAQDAIIQDLFSNEEAFDLVKSIIKNELFPDEFPIVVSEKGKHIVVEGNRRLAALKAMQNPDIVPLFRSKIKALEIPKGLNKIRVVEAPNRAAATQLIANKHTINYRRPWKPLRQAYFYKSQIDNGVSIEKLKEDYPEHDVSKFIRMLEAHHLAKAVVYSQDDVAAIVHDERKFPITNLERMYEDEYVSGYLGITFSPTGRITGNVGTSDFLKAYGRIVGDVATGVIDSRKYNTSIQRKEYIDNLPKELKPPKGGSTRFKASAIKELAAPSGGNLVKGKRSNRSHRGVIPSFIPFKITSTPLKAIYTELRNIDVHEFPNASHDLLRTFLECTLAFHLKNSGEYSIIKKNQHHTPKLSEMLTFVGSGNCTSITDASVRAAVNQVKTHFSEGYSLERMNLVNHNEEWASQEGDVRQAWMKIEGLMRILLDPSSNRSS